MFHRQHEEATKKKDLKYFKPNRLAERCTQFKYLGVKILFVLYLHDNVHSHINDMESRETKRFILNGFEFGTTMSKVSRFGLFFYKATLFLLVKLL